MHILIAPNAFKNSLKAGAVAIALQEGLQQSKLSFTSECFPVADGGDGTSELLIRKLNGDIINAVVHDPLGRSINSSFAVIEESKTAVIEMANASGLRLLQKAEYNPLHASSFGTGELILAALDKAVSKIIIAIGGSATVDGGTGILKALGIRFLDTTGKELEHMPESLTDLVSIDVSGLNTKIHGPELIVLCDVDNALLGAKGSAAVFGPQKGADTTAIKKLDASLTRLRDVILKQTGKDIAMIKHGGAAGGVAAGLAGLLNARLVKGIDYFLELAGFEPALQKADLVITGEGSIDLQTLEGKAPFGVAVRAKRRGLPVIGVAGLVPSITDPSLKEYFDVLLSINEEPFTMQEAIRNTADNLRRIGKMIGEMLAT